MNQTRTFWLALMIRLTAIGYLLFFVPGTVDLDESTLPPPP